MVGTIIILFLGLIAWFWLNSIRAKEIAMQASAIACKQIEAQFLDQTASLTKIRLLRNPRGRLTIHRTFGFDYSLDRETRSKGYVMINAHKVTRVLLEEKSGSTIL
jgi:hypothetical protein